MVGYIVKISNLEKTLKELAAHANRTFEAYSHVAKKGAIKRGSERDLMLVLLTQDVEDVQKKIEVTVQSLNEVLGELRNKLRNYAGLRGSENFEENKEWAIGMAKDLIRTIKGDLSRLNKLSE